MAEQYQLAGLQNQGATCYINALVQILFMTPEFRSIIFSWKYEKNRDGSEHLCIPLQLQKLFDLMDVAQQMRKPVKLDTRELTTSFGFDKDDVTIQQDLCELRDLLFNSLETMFKGTHVEGAIARLYNGKLTSQITSFESPYTSTKVEDFNCLHLQLPVGESQVDYTLSDAIEDYFRETFLCGENAFIDPGLKREVIASQTKIITHYPQHLSIQLGRFATHESIKNMLPIVIPYTLQVGSNIYEIYAIVMHIGYTLLSGHYYAYIRNEAHTWFLFDDSEVVEMDPLYVQNSSEGRLVEDEQAYLLLYRKVEID